MGHRGQRAAVRVSTALDNIDADTAQSRNDLIKFHNTYRAISKLHPGRKAIIASGFAETERVREAQKLGAGSYVKKPFRMEALALAIRQELER